jgi:streptogramin lyase
MLGRARTLAALVVCAFGLVTLSACGDSGAPAEDTATRAEAKLSNKLRHDTVVRVDSASGRVRAVIPVGPDPRLITTASGQVWSASRDDGTLSRVDPATGHAITVEVGEAVGFAVAGGDLWVAAHGNRLLRMDGASGAEKRSLRLARAPVFALQDAGFPVVGRGSLWLTVPKLGEASAPQSLWRVDPSTGKVLAKLPIGVNPTPPLADGRYIWMISRPPSAPGELTRIDMASGTSTNVSVGLFPWGLAAGAGSVWVGHTAPHEVWRLNPSSAKPTAKIPVDGEVRSVGFGGGFAWVLAGTSLLRVDPATNEVTRIVRLKSPSGVGGPSVLVYLDGSVWVSVE